MFPCTSRTVFDVPIRWNRARFHAVRTKYRRARKLIEISINVQLAKRVKDLCAQNGQIESAISYLSGNITKHERKLQTLDNMIGIGSESLSNHFNKRMEKIHTVIKEQCNIIESTLNEENEYWKDIYSVITSKENHYCGVPNYTLLPTIKQEWPEVVFSPEKSDHGYPSIDTCDVKMEESIDLSSLQLPNEHQAVSPVFTQPKFPEQLYFSPTILQNEPSELIGAIHAPLDEKEESFESCDPMILLDRINRTLLLQHLNEDDIERFDIQSNFYSQNPDANLEPAPRLRTRSTVTRDSQSIDRTKNRSVSTNVQTTATLRKQKSVVIIENENKTRKTKRTKRQHTSIKRSSLLPDVAASKQYSTRFSKRFHQLENLSSSIIEMKDENQNQDSSASKNWRSRLRKKA
ncbi:unnamed protein product [Adineta ricciae]|uniref:Uncharacterized protein n=1 Tax=Adineta ricciae TaxID=249248 RepID=A0A815EK21_ADIRI|nr:unnamed protein product [Adineta ricciae]